MRTTAEQLWAGVLECPQDAGRLLVLADYADETGDPALAAGLRWCAAHTKFPLPPDVTRARGWSWFWHDSYHGFPPGPPDSPAYLAYWRMDREQWGRIDKPLWDAIMPPEGFRYDPHPADHVRALGKYLLDFR